MTSSSSDALLVERHAACWTLRLNRPAKHNALDADLVERLLATLDEAAGAGVPVVLLQGQGGNFSAGFDLSDLEPQSDGDLLWRFVRVQLLLEKIEYAPFATVAFAQGANFGAGVDVFAACRFRFAAPNATFRMPGLAFELILGTERFASIVGADAAHDILQASRGFDAEEARRLGFVQAVIGAEQLAGELQRASEMAGMLTPRGAKLLHEAIRPRRGEALSRLVRSAAEPGLKQRIQRYLQSQRAARARRTEP